MSLLRKKSSLLVVGLLVVAAVALALVPITAGLDLQMTHADHTFEVDGVTPIAHADGGTVVADIPDFSGFDTLVTGVGTLTGTLTTVLIALAILLFIWGLVKFIWNAGNEEAKEEGKRIMIWGIIAIFVMVSVWGIVSFLQGSFGVDSTTIPDTFIPDTV